jgi:VanZ family protein
MASVAGRPRAYAWLCLLWVVFILYGTTIPFHFSANRTSAAARWRALTLNPLHSTRFGTYVRVGDVAQNILLFLPFGVLGAAALRRRQGPSRAARVIAAGAALSAAVEALQLFDSGRVASFADIVWNTSGTAVGVLASASVLDWSARAVRRLKAAGVFDARAVFPLMVGLALVCLSAWSPFDVTLDAGDATRKLRALGRDIWQTDGLANDLLEMIRFFVVTQLAIVWSRERRHRHPAAAGIGLGAALAIGLEVTQMFVTSRQPGLSDASVNVAGAIAGGLLLPVIESLQSPRMKAIAFAFALWIAALLHRPLWQLALAPLRYYAVVGHISELLLIYVPLGFGVAWVTRRRAAWFIAAESISLGHLWSLMLVERASVVYPIAVADSLIAVIGSAAGAWLCTTGRELFVRRIGSLEADATEPSRLSVG